MPQPVSGFSKKTKEEKIEWLVSNYLQNDHLGAVTNQAVSTPAHARASPGSDDCYLPSHPAARPRCQTALPQPPVTATVEHAPQVAAKSSEETPRGEKAIQQ